MNAAGWDNKDELIELKQVLEIQTTAVKCDEKTSAIDGFAESP